MIDAGVYEADPEEFAADDEEPNQIQVDALGPDTPIPEKGFKGRGKNKIGYGWDRYGSGDRRGKAGPYWGAYNWSDTKPDKSAWVPPNANTDTNHESPPSWGAAPDFVNMSYDQYQEWYNNQKLKQWSTWPVTADENGR